MHLVLCRFNGRIPALSGGSVALGPLFLSSGTTPLSIVLTKHLGLLGVVVSGGDQSLGSLLLLLGLLFGVTVQEEIDHNVPRRTSLDSVAEVQNLTAEEPPHQSDSLVSLVVAGDGNVYVRQRGVYIAEGNGGDVHVRRLLDGLVIGAGVGEDQQTWLEESLLDLVSEGSRGVTSGNGVSASVSSKLQDGSLSLRLGRDNADIGGVLDGHNNSGCKLELLPGLADVDQVNTVGTTLVNVSLHSGLKTGGTEVSAGGQKTLDVLLAGVQGFGELIDHCAL